MFQKKTWTDRIAEYITRRTLTNTADNSTMVVTVERNEGEVSQEGDAFSAENMNDLESRINDAFAEIVTFNGSSASSVDFTLVGSTLNITISQEA
jgi:hypothetical protein